MNVVDSSAWLEFLADGPNASYFAPAIEATGDLVVPSITIYEVFRRALQQGDARRALQSVGLMRRGRVVDLDAELAVAAATLAIGEKLSLADSVILATARRFDATLWTMDADFDGKPGVKYRARR